MALIKPGEGPEQTEHTEAGKREQGWLYSQEGQEGGAFWMGSSGQS